MSIAPFDYDGYLSKYCKYKGHGQIYMWNNIIIKYSSTSLELSLVPGVSAIFPLFDIIVDRSIGLSLDSRKNALAVMLTGMRLIYKAKHDTTNNTYSQKLDNYVFTYMPIFSNTDANMMNLAYEVYMLRILVKAQQNYINMTKNTIQLITIAAKKRSIEYISADSRPKKLTKVDSINTFASK
jgi:hypothetical protein